MAIFKAWFIDYEPFNGTIPDDWKEYKLSNFLPVITGKKNANIASNKGKYPFFSCSKEVSWTNEYSFEGNAILVAGNGDFNVKFYNGKFEAYQRTYVLIPNSSRYTAWLYYAVKYNLNKITSVARGSVIKFITKSNLEDFYFYAPEQLDDFKIIDYFDAINYSIATNTIENSKLLQLRDALLPKLLSGELAVSNIDI
jgi:Type I restriction modification DNA specificity domain.